MFFLSKPAPERIREFLQSQKSQPFSYVEVGASRAQQPLPGFDLDHHRIQLGFGAEMFERSRQALQRWKMFDMPWINLCWPSAPIETGSTVAVLASHARLWSLNACRIVYVIDEHGTNERYGFAYGTLPAHGERGEERFTVEFHSKDNSVWYDIFALSRPRLLARLAYPYARKLQRRFARDSMASMKRAAAM